MTGNKFTFLLPLLAVLLAVYSCKETWDKTTEEIISETKNTPVKPTEKAFCSGCKEPGLSPSENPQVEGKPLLEWVKDYAPVLRFDQAASTFPADGQEIWNRSRNKSCGQRLAIEDKASYTWAQVPSKSKTYYRAKKVGNRLFIDYWWGYFRQPPCFTFLGTKSGAHDYDWEHIMVQINAGTRKVISVSFFQHSGWYTLRPGGKSRGNTIQFDGTHVHVFVGKDSHGSYHYGGTIGGCAYWEDYRNNANRKWNTWNSSMLPLGCNLGVDWMSFRGDWGKPGKGPLFRDFVTTSRNVCDDSGCSGSNPQSGKLGDL